MKNSRRNRLAAAKDAAYKLEREMEKAKARALRAKRSSVPRRAADDDQEFFDDYVKKGAPF